MMRNIYKILLVVIVLLAFLLRVYHLNSNPPALSWDEAAWGYNAYALGTDGRDEFGVFLPYKYLESYGDFKPPVYAYLDIIPVKVFGLNAFAARFPSAFFGTLTVLLTYFLVKRLFFKFKDKKYKEYLALVSAFVLAVSPWHIMLSRAAFEANVATFFVVAGVLAFLKGVQSNKWYLLLSASILVIPFYTFNSPRVVVPILGIILVVGYWRKLWDHKLQSILAGVIVVLMLAPLIGFLRSPQAELRFQEVNIFTDSSIVKTSNQEIANAGNSPIAKLLNNRRVGYSLDFIKHYLDHFNPTFLFISGDVNPRFSTQDVGELYLWSIPFFIAGAFLLFYKREGEWWLIPVWLLVGIIPAATARETPHALRIETSLPMFQILVAYGFVSFLRKVKYEPKITIVLLILLGFNVVYFLHGYYAHYPREYSDEWQYGYEDAVNYVQSVQQNYTHIYVTDQLGRPYIYFLYYEKVPPQKYRSTAKIHRDTYGFVDILGFGKYSFGTNFSYKGHNKDLYVNVPSKVPKNAKILKKFSQLNGITALVAYKL